MAANDQLEASMSVPCPADLLRCPITGGDLRPLSSVDLARLNRQIAAGEIRHRDESAVRGDIQGGYQTLDGKFVYGVRDGIVLLLSALALTAESPFGDRDAAGVLRQEKHAVQDFYDEVGWVADEEGVFTDASLYEDLRDVAADYIRACHLRVGQHLPPRGRYLLDAASGPVQYPEYLTYSESFEARICVDLSYAALTAARRKLGDRGIYLLADVTNLPLRDGAVDAAVSLHTIYHVPADEQARAFRELARVLQPGGRAAVVYVWKTKWIRLAQLPVRLLQLPWRLARKVWRATAAAKPPAGPPRLHFHAHPYRWFAGQEWPFEYEIRSWRSVTAALTKSYCHGWLGGKAALRLVYWLEETCPRALGRHGAYPLILIDKPPADAPAAMVPRAA